jgi:hypothetical protein
MSIWESGIGRGAQVAFFAMTQTPSLLATCALFAVAVAGCPAPLAREARAQDAAQELNVHARFGRLGVAIDSVAPAEREAFTRRHKAWGNTVRVSDSEMAGMKLTTDEDAEVAVRVSWFRPTEQELRVTTIRQKWHDNKGSWQLVSEERFDGDRGLLGDDAPASDVPAKARANTQFPTIRIGEGETH